MRKSDLNKAEQRWRRRGLFSQRQRRRWPWWLLAVLIALALLAYHQRLF